MIEITKKTVLAIGGTVTALCARVTKITIYGDGTNTALLTVKDSNGGTVIDKLEAGRLSCGVHLERGRRHGHRLHPPHGLAQCEAWTP